MAEIVVGSEAELAPGRMLALKAGTRNIVVFRDESGCLSALEDRCSHAEVRLSTGKFEKGVVECPAHGARFDCKTGRPLCMPAVAPVKKFTVKVTDGKIIVVVP